jgi:hypothetical protein
MLMAQCRNVHRPRFVNGNFATGDFTGWTTSGGVAVSSGRAQFGIGGTFNGVISQDIPTSAGVTYTLSVAMGRAGPGGSLFLRVDALDVATGTQLATVTSPQLGSATVTLTWTAQGPTRIRVSDQSFGALANSDAFADNFVITAGASAS